MSGNYGSWVQLPEDTSCGCEHNSMKAGLFGLHDLVLVKGRCQSLTGYLKQCIELLLKNITKINKWINK